MTTPPPGTTTREVPTVSPVAVRTMIDTGRPVFLLDVRPEHYLAGSGEIIEGATWRDPERLRDWIGELPQGVPVVTICAFGARVGLETAAALRDAGFDAACMTGGHAAWKEMNGPVRPLG